MRNRQVAHNREVNDVEREVLLLATPDEVWEELSDPSRLGDWFGAHVDGDLSPGEPIRFTSPDGTERRAVVERSEPGRRLTFRYLPDEEAQTSRVDITLDEIPDGTILRVVERQITLAVSPTQRIGFKALARL
jgi:uncharacterized protein YndB with AHSA1/START domain